jgi:IPT/TIG domain
VAANSQETLGVTAVEPRSAPTSPGSRVKLYGSGFTPDTVVYFGGLQAREVKFSSPSVLEAVTRYLRPGMYKLQLRSGNDVLQSEVQFTALASAVDAELDKAASKTADGHASAATELLTALATTNPDYQVRAYAHYRAAQIAFTLGDRWRWADESGSVFENADESGGAIQSCWRKA